MSRSTHSHHPGFGEEEERQAEEEIRRQELEEQDREDEERRLKELYGRRVRFSGIPATLHELTLAKLRALDNQHTLYLALKEWEDDTLPGLFLYGDVGRGKTYMAAAAALGLMHHRPVKFAPVPSLMRDLLADFASDEYRRALALLNTKQALVLDDLGQERSNDSVREALHTLVDTRYLARIPLLITSNFTPSQLGERYGAWLASRLADMRCLRAVGPDIRLEGP